MTEGGGAPRFVADHMLGSLARWLRMMGYDTVYDKSLDDPGIANLARAESRFILTRDRELAKEPGALMIEADDLDSQLKAIAEKYGLKFHDDLIRCSACNGELADLDKAQAKDVRARGRVREQREVLEMLEVRQGLLEGHALARHNGQVSQAQPSLVS